MYFLCSKNSFVKCLSVGRRSVAENLTCYDGKHDVSRWAS